MYPYQLLPQERESQSKRQPFVEAVRMGLFPSVLAAAAALQEGPRFWVTLTLAVGVFLANFAVPAWSWLRTRRALARDWRRTRLAFVELRRFIVRFREYTDGSDRFEDSVFHQLLHNNVTDRERLPMLSARVLLTQWSSLERRSARQPRTLDDAMQHFDDFDSLLHTYLHEHVQPVFERLPAELRPRLTPEVARSFEAFREKLVAFLNEYTEFSRRLGAELEIARKGDPYLPRPKPLTVLVVHEPAVRAVS